MSARRARVIWLGTVVAAALCAAPAAQATTVKSRPIPAKVCSVLTDPANDATVYVGGTQADGAGAGTVPSDASLDVRSVGLSVSGNRLAASIKVTKLAVPDPSAPFGQYFSLAFRVGEDTLLLDGVVTPLGDRAWIDRADGSSIGGDTRYAAQIAVDTTTQQVVLSAALSDIGHFTRVRTGSRLTHIEALTQRIVGASNDQGDTMALVGADHGVTNKTYVIGATRCS